MKASILINNYNYQNYVENAIRSCLSQTYKNVEIILYDDGSTDKSLEIINQFADKIQIISRENYKKGHCWNQIHAVNEAFKQSTGDVIFLLDSDDCFFPEKVERVMAEFKAQPDIVAVQHPFRLINEKDEFIKLLKRPIFSDIDILKSIYFTKRQDFYFTQTSGLCFSRAFMEQVLPLPEDDLPLIAVDIRLSRLALFAGRIVTLRDKLAAYRVHTSNHSAALKDRSYYQEYDRQNIAFLNRLAKRHNKPEFKYGNTLVAYTKVILLLAISGMQFEDKVEFMKSWVSSFLNK